MHKIDMISPTTALKRFNLRDLKHLERVNTI